MERKHYTLRKADVGKRTIRAFGQRWHVDDFIGHIGAYDVGKRVYLVGDFLQVENAEQMRRRLGPTKNPSGASRRALPKRKANGQFAKKAARKRPVRRAKPRKRASR